MSGALPKRLKHNILNDFSQNYDYRALSSAWLEHLTFNQGVAGSNPVGPI